MRLRHVLIYSVATATVALVSPAITPVIDMPSVAQAEVSVSISTFYDDLAPYGSWVSYHDTYVFVPADVPDDWRPYTVGHWVYTERYGWLWVSDEPFGWATYHYGRWGYAEDIGWYWVPGRRWAPAWVSWRRSADYVVWAPLPPSPDFDTVVVIEVVDIPDEYWIAVPSRSFLEINLSVVVIDDDRERVRVVEAAEPVGNVVIENNIVVNNVIDVDFIEKETKKKVEPVAVKETDDPAQAGKPAEGEVAVFTGEVKEDKDAKPKKVKEVDEVQKEQAEKKGEAPEGTEGVTPTEEQPVKKKKGVTGQPAQPEEALPEAAPEQPVKKKKAMGQPAQPEEALPEAAPEQPVKKKKKATGQPAQPEEALPEAAPEQPVKKKKKATAQPAQPEEALPEAAPEQPVQKKKKKPAPEEQPPAGACDPATGQGC